MFINWHISRAHQYFMCPVSQHLLDPAGHRIAQLPEVVDGHVLDPDQLGQGSDCPVILQLGLHVPPAVFNGA